MVDRERRRTAAEAALSRRLAAWALPALLVAACGEPSGAAHAQDLRVGDALSVVSPGSREPVLDRDEDEPPASSDARIPRLDAEVRGIVERWTEAARKRSKGKAHAGNVGVSVFVQEPSTGHEVVSIDADTPRTPASNMKLVTTAAALVLLGPDMEFLTAFEARGKIRRGVLEGDLVVRASGDPLIETAGERKLDDRLADVARALREHGVRIVTGDLVLDEGSFDEPAPGPGWPAANQHWQDYCALSGGFTVNGGVLEATVRAGSAGTGARVEVAPAPYGLRSKIDVKTSGGRRLDVRVGASTSTVTVVGTIPASRREFVAGFSHPDPVSLFGSVVLARLERGGVRIDGGVRRARDIASGTRLAELRSSVNATLTPINADSLNGVADQLFLALGNGVGGAGTRAGGASATRRALKELGVSSSGLVQVDGSGLSRDNRITARQISALLSAVLARDARTRRLFLDSLAVAGESGTLEERLAGTSAAGRVRGKTGWISGVSSLSGVCETLARRTLVVSILVEYPPALGGMNTNCFKPMQDEILRLLVEHD